MNLCKIITDEGVQYIVHPNGLRIPRVITTEVRQFLHNNPQVRIELFTDKRLQPNVCAVLNDAIFMPNGDEIPYVSPGSLVKIDDPTERYSFNLICEF